MARASPLIHHPALDEFRSLASSWAPFFRTQLRVALALKDSSGWHLCYAFTFFLPAAQATAASALDIETKSIRAVRKIVTLDVTSAKAAIEEALKDPTSFQCDGWTTSLEGERSSLPTFEYQRLYSPRMPGPKRIPTLTISNPSPSYRQFPSLSELDQELLANNPPYDGLQDLLLDLSVPVPIAEIGKSPFAEVSLLPPAAVFFDGDIGSNIQNGKMSLVIEAHPALEPSKLGLGIKAFAISQATRKFLSGNDIEWQQMGDVVRASHVVDLPDVPVALVILSYDGEYIGKWWVRDFTLSFNPLLQLHRCVDVPEKLSSTFFEDRNDFEDRASLLLTLLGLIPLKYGAIAHWTDAPDILARSAGGHLYVIDCTTGDINNKGKLHRLYDRTKAIKETLSRSAQPPIAVLPVIMTSLTRQETAAHWQMATAYKIAIVAREDITGLLTRLEAPPSAEHLYDLAVSCIPEASVGSPTTRTSGSA